MSRFSNVLIGLSGAMAIGFGAFAAHSIDHDLRRAWIQTGATYQLIFTLAAWVALLFPGKRMTAILFGLGIVFFCGSLYAMGLGAPRWLGAVTPIGGLAFIMGWLSIGWSKTRNGGPQS